MQFQIPQFIEVENKIVGPLSIRQFLYIAAAVCIAFLLFFVLQTWLWLIITSLLGGISIAFAFGKYNGQTLPKMFWRATMFFWQPKLYIWKREKEEKTIDITTKLSLAKIREIFASSQMINVKKLWQDLNTTKTPIPKREKNVGSSSYFGKKTKEKFEVFRKITGEKEITRRVDYR